MDLKFNLCGGDIVKFWCHLYKNEGDEYRELSSLALLLLSIFPTSVLCERGMNYVKNEYRSVMTLNACLSIIMYTGVSALILCTLFPYICCSKQVSPFFLTLLLCMYLLILSISRIM